MMNQPRLLYQLKEIKIEVTYKCPLVCIHCSSQATPTNTIEISKEKCLDIITQAASMGVNKIAFSGGEPLVWPYIEDAVNLSSKLGMDIAIYTSGNIDNQDVKFKALKKAGLNRAVFSIFADNEQIHEQITRVKGSFNKTINAIKEANNNNINTEIHFVSMTNNYETLDKVAELAKSKEVDSISVLRFVPQGRGKWNKDFVLNKQQNKILKNTIEDLRKRGYNIRTGSPYNVLLLNEKPACNSAKDRIIVSADLSVYPCDAFKQIKAEDIVDTINYSTLVNTSLQECWENSPYLNIVRNCLISGFEEPCKSCTMLDRCLSGCLAQKVIYNGKFINVPDPICMLNKY